MAFHLEVPVLSPAVRSLQSGVDALQRRASVVPAFIGKFMSTAGNRLAKVGDEISASRSTAAAIFGVPAGIIVAGGEAALKSTAAGVKRVVKGE